MTILDHKPHIPWRHVRAVITPHGDDEHHVDVQVSHTDEPSIAAWLATGDRRPSAAEASPTHVPLAGFWPTPGRREVRPHREFDDDTELATALLAMERETHALADTLAGENDTRMTLLLAASEAAVKRSAARVRYVARLFEQSWTAQVFARRRARIRSLVPALGHLLAVGDVSQETAAAVMVLRSRYLNAVDTDSVRIPRLTPELLARLDAERGVAA